VAAGQRVDAFLVEDNAAHDIQASHHFLEQGGVSRIAGGRRFARRSRTASVCRVRTDAGIFRIHQAKDFGKTLFHAFGFGFVQIKDRGMGAGQLIPSGFCGVGVFHLNVAIRHHVGGGDFSGQKQAGAVRGLHAHPGREYEQGENQNRHARHMRRVQTRVQGKPDGCDSG